MAKKPKIPEHANHERWLVSYADFITLLFAFFTVLYATSQTDEGKIKKLVGSVDRSFNTGIFSAGSDNLMFGEGGEFLGDGVYNMGLTLKEAEKEISSILGTDGKGGDAPPDIKIEPHTEGLSLIIQTQHFFSTGDDQLQLKVLAQLQKVVPVLKKTTFRMRIEGNTDDLPIATSRFPSNWELSTARALAVRQWLEEQGVDAKRMSVAGFADNQPLVPNTSEKNRARNRRVEIIILAEKPLFWEAPGTKKLGANDQNLPDSSGWSRLVAEDINAGPSSLREKITTPAVERHPVIPHAN